MTVSSTSRPSDRSLGIVYTPTNIAKAIVAEVLPQTEQQVEAILEPSVGDGAFLEALNDLGQLAAVTALDIDDRAVERVRIRFPSARIELGDFLSYAADTVHRYGLIIGNPPYIRRKNFSEDAKLAIEMLAERQNYPRTNLKNAWAAFVVAAEALLANEGTLAFVVPYELMNVDYGIALQRWLSERFERLDVYIPDEKAFKQIDQDAVLLIARRKSTLPGAFVRRVTNLGDLRSEARPVDLTTAHTSTNLKGFLLAPEILERIRQLAASWRTVSEFCKSGAGIVTAANDYFILTDKDVSENGLDAWAKPILKKSAYLGIGPIFKSEDFDRIRKTLPANFIDLNAYDENHPDPAIEGYLQRGRDAKIPNSYKARHRQQWFKVPVTWLGQGFFFKRSHAYPRLCINAASVLVTDTAYSIEPVAPATMRGLCYSFYNSVTLLMSEIEGRFYGGGVLELTPNEFRRLPLYYSEPTDNEFDAFCDPALWANSVDLALKGDERLATHHGFERSELMMLHNAWKTLRNHRLRHGHSM
jgi:adenine-specific DNA-methyltransferase